MTAPTATPANAPAIPPANSPVLDAILERMNQHTDMLHDTELDLEARIRHGVLYRIREIVGDDTDRLPSRQEDGHSGDPDAIPTYWWNWPDMAVGFAVDGDHLVVFEQKTTFHALSEARFADHLMSLIEREANRT